MMTIEKDSGQVAGVDDSKSSAPPAFWPGAAMVKKPVANLTQLNQF
jgi:hypothetical protein